MAKKANGKFYGTGRRKSSIARVYLVPGNGNITINKRSLDEYFGLETLKEMMEKKPEKVIELAVKGMLPKGPLGRQMFTKLHVYAGPDHEQAAQKPEVLKF